MNHAIVTHTAAPSPPHRHRLPLARRVVRGLRRAIRLVEPVPSVEEAVRRMRSRPSLIASLTPEQIAEFRNWDEPSALCGPLDDAPQRQS
jgi:hypothetical protein